MPNWKHTYNTFYEGETNDTFIPTGNKYLSSYNVDPSTNPRWIQLHGLLNKQYGLTTTSDIISSTTVPNGRIDLSGSEAFYNGTSITSTVGLPGYSYMGFLYDTTGAQKNFFFGTSTNIARLNADCTVNETGAITKATGTVTSVVKVANTLLFSIGNVIYKIDNASAVGTVLSTIPYGSVIKKMYLFNDILYVFTQLGADTLIYHVSYDGTNYAITYTHTKEDVSIYDMAGSGGVMYWISNRGLYQTNGIDSQLIKNYTFTSVARCSIYKDSLLYMINGTDVLRYGTELVGFPKAFVKIYTHISSLVTIEGKLIFEARTSGESDLMAFETTRFATTGEIITIPYDAGIMWAEKSLDVIDFAYELKSGMTGAKIEVMVQTNLMELAGTGYVTVKSLTDLSNSVMRCRIDKIEILASLSSNNPDFQYIRFKFVLTGGNLDVSSRAQYTPKLYQDIYIGGEFINDVNSIG